MEIPFENFNGVMKRYPMTPYFGEPPNRNHDALKQGVIFLYAGTP